MKIIPLKTYVLRFHSYSLLKPAPTLLSRKKDSTNIVQARRLYQKGLPEQRQSSTKKYSSHDTRLASQEVTIFYSTIQRVLREQHLYPCHLQHVQALSPTTVGYVFQWLLVCCKSKFFRLRISSSQVKPILHNNGIVTIYTACVDCGKFILTCSTTSQTALLTQQLIGYRSLRLHLLPNRNDEADTQANFWKQHSIRYKKKSGSV